MKWLSFIFLAAVLILLAIGAEAVAFPFVDSAPTAAAYGRNIDLQSQHPTTIEFTVMYADDLGINVETIGTGDIRVVSSMGFDVVPILTAISNASNGIKRVATYQFPATPEILSFPGQLRMQMQTNEVADIGGNFVPAGEIGKIEIGLSGTPTPTPTPPPACLMVENFDHVADLAGRGWVQSNQSSTLGSQPEWYQGDVAIFPASSGPLSQSGYAAVNYNSAAGSGTISNWLLTPVLNLENGATFTFLSRTVGTPQFPDRLQVRLSTNGESTNVGPGPNDVGDFTTLYIDLNPTYTLNGYPKIWTQYEATIQGLSGPTTGRLGFRYFVENGGPDGFNSHYIGIDTFRYSTCVTVTPTPTATPTITPTPTMPPSPTPGVQSNYDFDGDGRSDLAVYRPSTGSWVMRLDGRADREVQFGISTDKIVPADYDADGKTDIAVYRPETGTWYIFNSSNGTFSYHFFGIAEDRPTPADYDGDKIVDISVFRPSTGTWYRLNSSDGSFFAYQFGANGDRPARGDFDGDGKYDIAVFRPSTGVWYGLDSSDGTFFAQQFGLSVDQIAPADYDGDGKTDIAVRRAVNENLWYIQYSSTNTFFAYAFFQASGVPVPADYDGDGKDDIALFRSEFGSSAHWLIVNSSTNSTTEYDFGDVGDKAPQNAFNGQ